MKKIIALILIAIMTLSLFCSCNMVTPDSTTDNNENAEISALKAQIEELQKNLNNNEKSVETVIVEVEKTVEVEKIVEVTVPVEITVPVPVTEVTKPIDTTPVTGANEATVNTGGVTIIYPTKATLSYYLIGFSGAKTKYSSCEVSDIKVTYSPSSFLSSLKLSFTVKKTFDKDGNNNIDSCEFRYRLKDETTGLIVDDSCCYTTKISVGEATKEEESIFEDLIAGHTYRIVFYDYEI